VTFCQVITGLFGTVVTSPVRDVVHEPGPDSPAEPGLHRDDPSAVVQVAYL